jgi:triosephosphate isomerase
MRTPLIAGNWKMHGSKGFVNELLSALIADVPSTVETVIFPPFVFLSQTQELLQNTPIKFGAQNVSPHAQGAYTGEISATMLSECGCDYVLIGHSERRQLYGETNELCVEKVIAAQKARLEPILCVGETLDMREQGLTFHEIEQQLSAVLNESQLDAGNIIIAYEPVWAIGTGRTATAEQAQEVHQFVREKVTLWRGGDIAQKMRILYGGSVKADNAASLLSQRDVDGALVGGASLVLESFVQICRAAASCVS